MYICTNMYICIILYTLTNARSQIESYVYDVVRFLHLST